MGMVEEYGGDELPEALAAIPLVGEVTLDDLFEMGWYQRGSLVRLKLEP